MADSRGRRSGQAAQPAQSEVNQLVEIDLGPAAKPNDVFREAVAELEREVQLAEIEKENARIRAEQLAEAKNIAVIQEKEAAENVAEKEKMESIRTGWGEVFNRFQETMSAQNQPKAGTPDAKTALTLEPKGVRNAMTLFGGGMQQINRDGAKAKPDASAAPKAKKPDKGVFTMGGRQVEIDLSSSVWNSNSCPKGVTRRPVDGHMPGRNGFRR